MKTESTWRPARALALAAFALSLSMPNTFGLTQATPVNPGPVAMRNVAAGAPPNSMTADIRDIRGPKHIPSPWLWPALVAGGLGLGTLGWALWRWKRRRARATAKLPYEIALDRLEEARALMQPESAREFSIAVSEITRNYIEERFHVRAARRTTEEFLYDLLEASDALLGGHRALLAVFLHHCDIAKFARWILSTREMETMLQGARAFVMETGRPATTAVTETDFLSTADKPQNL
jgi:hypothetical protein